MLMNAVQNTVQPEGQNGSAEIGEAAEAASQLQGELAFAIFLLLLVGSVFWQALTLPFIEPGGAIGSGFFPISLAVIVMLLIIFHGVFGMVKLIRMRKEQRASGTKSTQKTSGINRDQLVLLGLIILAVLVGDRIGLFATAGMVLLFGLLFIERVGLRASLLFTLGTLVAIYLIFDFWLGMKIGLSQLF